ncbi:MAG: DNA/RNA helicase domain-containing protein [Bacillota bacterium]|nr:DNA/RNA helicase domain-containing protein [Bacillota bacterium]
MRLNWFLNPKDDTRSSFFLEDTATEFDIQGLELDWTCVAWDADLRFDNEKWTYQRFRGTKWQNINNEEGIIYLKNAYRVLLTRARQGMVIFLPTGNDSDNTRRRDFYDGTYNYLIDIGVECI